jgi:hypothetical protein
MNNFNNFNNFNQLKALHELHEENNRKEKQLLKTLNRLNAVKAVFVFMIIVCSGCQHLNHIQFDARHKSSIEESRVFALARLKEIAEYRLNGFDEHTNVNIHFSKYSMSKKLKLKHLYDGWYNPFKRDINLYRFCSFKVSVHEWCHYFLHSAGIPLSKHHKIIEKII